MKMEENSIIKSSLRYILYVLTVILGCNGEAYAIDMLNPPVYSDKDTVEITEMVRRLKSESDIRNRHLMAANMLLGRGEDMDEREDSTGVVKLNIQTFTPLSFINSVHALAMAAERQNPDWRDYATEYEKISCRRGEDAGFASVLRYGCDWIADNVYRGNLKELTENYAGVQAKTKSVDYISRHRDEYAALANPEIFDKVEMTDMGYKQHRIPYLKRHFITRSDVADDIRNGDIILLLSNDDGKDIYGIFYVENEDGKIYLTGYDPLSHKVTTLKEPADRMFKLLVKNFYGFRWLRWE